MPAERRHLDDLAAAEMDVSQPETPADDEDAVEILFDLPGTGIGDDVEILGNLAQHHVADGTAGQIGGEAETVKAKDDAQGVRIDIPPRDPVLGFFHDKRFSARCRGQGVIIHGSL